MALANEGYEPQEVPEIERVPSISTSKADDDTPTELPKFIFRGQNWSSSRTQRSKSVPNASHTVNGRAPSNTRQGSLGLRFFKRSFSVQGRSLRYIKMSSIPSARGSSGEHQEQSPNVVKQEVNLGAQVLRETNDSPPPQYSSLDSSLDIIPGYPSRVNHAFRGNGSTCIMNNDPPPSYRELFNNRMRNTVRHMSVHSTTSEFTQECSHKKMAKFFGIGIFFLVFAIVLPVTMVIQGITHLDECPIEPRIPIFLIIGGLLQLLECMGRLICKHCTPDQQAPENRDKMSWDPLLYILIILQILSSIYIYQTNPNFEPEVRVWKINGNISGNRQITAKPVTASTSETHQNLYCHETTYKLAYWIVTTYYVIIMAVIVLMVVFVMCSSYLTYREQRRMGRQDRDEDQV